MTGAIAGDIIGSRFEFNNTFDYGFTLFTRANDFTDDTICTIAIADAVMHSKPFDTTLREWCRRYPYPMGGYGSSFALWVRDNGSAYYSYGNGSAMRVSSIGWLAKTKEEAVDLAAMSASVTHDHPEGIKGAVSVAEAVWHAVHDFANARHHVECTAGKYYPEYRTTEFIRGRFDETCQGTVPLAFRIALDSADFEDAIRSAVSFGGDSDTLAAIVGSIAEPLFGIPYDIRKMALSYLDADMLRIFNEFDYLSKK